MLGVKSAAYELGGGTQFSHHTLPADRWVLLAADEGTWWSLLRGTPRARAGLFSVSCPASRHGCPELTGLCEAALQEGPLPGCKHRVGGVLNSRHPPGPTHSSGLRFHRLQAGGREVTQCCPQKMWSLLAGPAAECVSWETQVVRQGRRKPLLPGPLAY